MRTFRLFVPIDGKSSKGFRHTRFKLCYFYLMVAFISMFVDITMPQYINRSKLKEACIKQIYIDLKRIIKMCILLRQCYYSIVRYLLFLNCFNKNKRMYIHSNNWRKNKPLCWKLQESCLHRKSKIVTLIHLK